mgnify:CR=1 FL=1
MSHRPGGLQEEQRRSAFTGPVRAASGAWRRPERPQGLPRAGRTARARGRGRVGAPPAHAAPGEGSAPGGWASDLPAVANCVAGRGTALILSTDERAHWLHLRQAHLKKKGTRSLLCDAPSSKSTRWPHKITDGSFDGATGAAVIHLGKRKRPGKRKKAGATPRPFYSTGLGDAARCVRQKELRGRHTHFALAAAVSRTATAAVDNTSFAASVVVEKVRKPASCTSFADD